MASSSDWPPDKKKTPGTAGGTRRRSVRSVSSAVRAGLACDARIRRREQRGVGLSNRSGKVPSPPRPPFFLLDAEGNGEGVPLECKLRVLLALLVQVIATLRQSHESINSGTRPRRRQRRSYVNGPPNIRAPCSVFTSCILEHSVWRLAICRLPWCMPLEATIMPEARERVSSSNAKMTHLLLRSVNPGHDHLRLEERPLQEHTRL